MPAPAPASLRLVRRCWRVLAPRWAHDPLSGAGAARNGGRFNPPGVPALYLSETLMVAIAEYEQDIGLRPGTFCAYDLSVSGIVDLTDARVRSRLRVRAEDLLCPWKEIAFVANRRPPTWTLGERLRRRRSAGVRVPSARYPGGVNVVLWRWNDSPRHRVKVIDLEGDLPRDQASWSD